MMRSQQTLNFRKTALSRLTSLFKDKPRIRGLVENMVEPLEELSNDFSTLQSQRWVNSARGKQLDGCGYLVGISRQGRGDEEFRTAIKARILSNVSSGTASDLIEGVKFLTNAQKPQYLESYPACAILFSDGDSVPTGSQQVMQDIAPAAIETVPLLVSYGKSKPVRLSGLTLASIAAVSDSQGEYTPLIANDSLLSISGSQPIGGTGLAGTAVTKTKIVARRRGIKAGVGGLAVGTDQVHDNGYHLTGVFQ